MVFRASSLATIVGLGVSFSPSRLATTVGLFSAVGLRPKASAYHAFSPSRRATTVGLFSALGLRPEASDYHAFRPSRLATIVDL